MYRMDKIREWFSYSFGGLTAMGGILSLNDWAVIIGILCTVGTFGINWYYKRKEREDRLNGNVTGSPKSGSVPGSASGNTDSPEPHPASAHTSKTAINRNRNLKVKSPYSIIFPFSPTLITYH